MIFQVNFKELSIGQNILRKDNGYVSMYGRELKFNGFKSRFSKRAEYGEMAYWPTTKPTITGVNKGVSYTFSRDGGNKFKDMVQNQQSEEYIPYSTMYRLENQNLRGSRSFTAGYYFHQSFRTNTKRLQRNQSGSEIYNFKNDYFSTLSKNNAEFTDSASLVDNNGNIIHDIDTIAERFIQNSQILGERGEREIRSLKRTRVPIPTMYSTK